MHVVKTWVWLSSLLSYTVSGPFLLYSEQATAVVFLDSSRLNLTLSLMVLFYVGRSQQSLSTTCSWIHQVEKLDWNKSLCHFLDGGVVASISLISVNANAVKLQ